MSALTKFQEIVERCGNPSGKGDKDTWPDGGLSHFIAAFGEDNHYAEPGGAICAECVRAVEAMLKAEDPLWEEEHKARAAMEQLAPQIRPYFHPEYGTGLGNRKGVFMGLVCCCGRRGDRGHRENCAVPALAVALNVSLPKGGR